MDGILWLFARGCHTSTLLYPLESCHLCLGWLVFPFREGKLVVFSIPPQHRSNSSCTREGGIPSSASVLPTWQQEGDMGDWKCGSPHLDGREVWEGNGCPVTHSSPSLPTLFERFSVSQRWDSQVCLTDMCGFYPENTKMGNKG